MHIYTKIYEFAASAGALEGFVYKRKDLDPDALPAWINNLVMAYQHLPLKTRSEIQPSLDQTVGRAIRSLSSVLSEDNELVMKLHTIVKGPLPKSTDDFQKKKWFEK